MKRILASLYGSIIPSVFNIILTVLSVSISFRMIDILISSKKDSVEQTILTALFLIAVAGGGLFYFILFPILYAILVNIILFWKVKNIIEKIVVTFLITLVLIMFLYYFFIDFINQITLFFFNLQLSVLLLMYAAIFLICLIIRKGNNNKEVAK